MLLPPQRFDRIERARRASPDTGRRTGRRRRSCRCRARPTRARTAAGSGVTLAMIERAARSRAPCRRCRRRSTASTDSVRICQTMSRRRAPSALRRPISRVRSLTTISMMFMMTMPPTTSDSATTPISTAKMPLGGLLVECQERVRREHAEVVALLRAQPALDAQRHRRVVHGRAAIESGAARLDESAARLWRDAEHLLEHARAG